MARVNTHYGGASAVDFNHSSLFTRAAPCGVPRAPTARVRVPTRAVVSSGVSENSRVWVGKADFSAENQGLFLRGEIGPESRLASANPDAMCPRLVCRRGSPRHL